MTHLRRHLLPVRGRLLLAGAVLKLSDLLCVCVHVCVEFNVSPVCKKGYSDNCSCSVVIGSEKGVCDFKNELNVS